jgi:hypothetical protein
MLGYALADTQPTGETRSHLAGIIAGNPGFDRNVQTINGAKTFVGDNFTATTNQTKLVTINALANDTDADSTIAPAPTIQTNPTNGAIALYLYLPAMTFDRDLKLS